MRITEKVISIEGSNLNMENSLLWDIQLLLKREGIKSINVFAVGIARI